MTAAAARLTIIVGFCLACYFSRNHSRFKPGPRRSPREEPLGINGGRFHQLDDLPITQPTVSQL